MHLKWYMASSTLWKRHWHALVLCNLCLSFAWRYSHCYSFNTFHFCVSTHMCTCFCVHTCTYVWRPEVDGWVSSLTSLYLILFPFNVYVRVHMCNHVHTYVDTKECEREHVCTHVCRSTRLTSGIYFDHPSTLFFKSGSLSHGELEASELAQRVSTLARSLTTWVCSQDPRGKRRDSTGMHEPPRH